MDNPEILETLVTQILDCLSVLSNVYLLPIVCPVSCVTNVSNFSGLSVLDCLSVFSNVYLLPIVCPVSCVTNVSSISGLTGNIGHRRKMTYNR
jgi:CxxC motif-containing protein